MQPKAKQAIFLFLMGGPTQNDTFDMKPDRPAEVRGPFKPIATTVPGLEICEHLPRLAKLTNKYSVLRSVNARGYPEAGDHFGGHSWKTGNPRALRGTPKYPMYGSVVSKLCPAPRDLPAVCRPGRHRHPCSRPQGKLPRPRLRSADRERRCAQGQRSAIPLTQMLAPAQIDVPGFERNVDLLRRWSNRLASRMRRCADRRPGSVPAESFRPAASPRLRQALQLEKEPDRVHDRYAVKLENYGKTNFTRRVLAARRLIEAGVPFVYVDFPYWDWHGGGGLDVPLATLPAFDAAFASLIEDLDERGLLETTAVIATGEMGRTPKVASGKPYGREHWSASQIVLVAGGGFQPGVVVGATDQDAAYVKDGEYKVASLGKTLYHLLGLDPDHELLTPDNRPLKLITEDVPLIKEVLA